MINRIFQENEIFIAAHRGYSAKYPENTLLAFKKAIDQQVDMLEFDLRLSKDGEVMIIHDETVDRTTNGSGKVEEFTVDELKKLDAGQGETIPTLRELCELVSAHPHILLNVEIKPQGGALEVVDKSMDILEEFHLVNRSVFTSFDAKVIHYLVDNYHVKTQGFPQDYMIDFNKVIDGTLSKLTAVALQMEDVTVERVRAYRDAGKLVWCYCPDEEATVQHSIDCGVSLVTCNEISPALKKIKNM